MESGFSHMFKKAHLIIALFLFLLASFSGCSTTPIESGLPTYNIGGIQYAPLVPICNAYGIKWSYDTYAHTINLRRDTHTVSMLVGDDFMLVDGQKKDLRHPVNIYQGQILVPGRFNEYLQELFPIRSSQAQRREISVPMELKRVVIDPGHGGKDPGAISRSGLQEKNVNLDIALRLKNMFERSGVSVVMTRTYDVFIPLPRRAEIANRSGADIFISVHSNANPSRSMNGFEVYYVSGKISDYQRALSLARISAPQIKGSSLGSNSNDLKVTLWDMIYTNNRAESIDLAGNLCQTASRNIRVPILGVKGANYYVLKNVRIPAVLIEVGFLSNSYEERLLRDSAYRQQIAESIFEGVGRYSKNASLIMEASRN